jgi:RHS repeat-associated protein
VFATNTSGVKVWTASYDPFGAVRTTTGTPIAARFPGQWFQSESGLHQNWMRDYDPTTGRYLQADPLGLVDGASVYGYAMQSPQQLVDPQGLRIAPQDPSTAKRRSDPIQCQAGWGSCEQMWEEEQTNCQSRFGAMIITDRKACFDRALAFPNLCGRASGVMGMKMCRNQPSVLKLQLCLSRAFGVQWVRQD